MSWRDIIIDDHNESALKILTDVFLDMDMKILNWSVFLFSFGTQDFAWVKLLLLLLLPLKIHI